MMVGACTQTIIHKTNKTTNVVGSTSQYKTAQNKKERLKTSLLRGATGIRTRDTRIFSPLLYQLSYGTIVMSCLICLSECKDIHFFLICKLFRKNYFIFFHHPCNKISYNPIYQQFTVEIKIQKKSIEITASILEFDNTGLLRKSFTPLLFEHITNENREVGVAFGEAELVSDVGTLVVVSWLACVGLDVLTL